MAQNEKLWKKTGKLAAHFTSSNHQEALNALLAFQNKSTHIDMLLDKDCRKALIEEEDKTHRNREAIKALLDVARTLGCQGISFRGSSNEKDGNGNFRQIVSLVSRHSSSLKRWLDDAENHPHGVNYLPQNEFLTLVAKDVSCRIVYEIHKAGMFSVIADTMPDVSHGPCSTNSFLFKCEICKY